MSNSEPAGDGPATPTPSANGPANPPQAPAPPAQPHNPAPQNSAPQNSAPQQPTTPYAPPPTTPYAPPPARPAGLYQQQPQFQPNQYRPAPYPAGGQYQAGQYQAGQYQAGQYQAGQYQATQYQPQPYQPMPYQPQPYQPTSGQPNWAAGSYPMAGSTPGPARRVRRKPMIAAIVALVLAIGLGGVAYQQYQASRTPTQVVMRYFAALAAGKASDALDFAATPPHGQYLTSAVLAQQMKAGRISEVHVDGVTESGDQARANVAYTLGLSQGARSVHDVVPLTRHGATWKLASPAPSVDLGVKTSGGDRVLLAGAALPSTPVYLFPGALPLTTDSGSVAVQDQPNVRFADDGQDLDLAVALTTAARSAISQTLRTALLSCFSGKSTDPNCPQSDEEREVPDSLVGTVAPITSGVTIQLDGTGGGEVELTGAVTVKGSWKIWDFNNQAVAKSGNTNVTVHAVTSVADPTKLFWRS